MQFNKFFLCFLIFILIPLKYTYAWNSLGHQIVAQIAWDNLSPEAKIMVQNLDKGVKGVYAKKSFVNSGPWLDKLRYKRKLLSQLHYIGLPYSPDHRKVKPAKKYSAVSAINYAIQILLAKSSSHYEKGFNLRILIHVIGDLHQPLHAINYYSNLYPYGDHGGNFILLAPNEVAANLHGYWDNGGGWLKVKHPSAKLLKQEAENLEKLWPCTAESELLDPRVWADESYKLAINKVYRLQAHTRPSKAYQEESRLLSQQRIALAGCRLANLLNKLALK